MTKINKVMCLFVGRVNTHSREEKEKNIPNIALNERKGSEADDSGVNLYKRKGNLNCTLLRCNCLVFYCGIILLRLIFDDTGAPAWPCINPLRICSLMSLTEPGLLGMKTVLFEATPISRFRTQRQYGNAG